MTIFEVLDKEISRKIDDILENLANGSAKDYAEYRYYCGITYGLYALKTYIEELKQNLEGEE